MPLILRISGCFVSLLSLISSPATDEKPTDDLPTLVEFVNDDLSQDSRSDYDVEGRVDWSDGRFTLASESQLHRKVPSGPRMRIRLGLTGPVAGEESSVFSIKIVKTQNGEAGVRILREEVDGQVQTLVQIFRITKRVLLSKLDVVGSELASADLQTGDWTIDYRYGVITVTGPGNLIVKGYTGSDAPGISDIHAAALRGSWDITQFTVFGIRSPELIAGAAAQTAREYLAKMSLGAAQRRRGEFAAARLSYQQAVDLAEAFNAPDRLPKLQAQMQLADVLQDTGDFRESSKLFEEHISLLADILGEEHPDVATAWNNLGVAYRERSRYHDAGLAFSKAKNARQSVLGPLHLSTVSAMMNGGALLIDLAAYRQSESILEASLLALDEADSADARVTDLRITVLNNLGICRRYLLKFEAAEAALNEALQLAEATASSSARMKQILFNIASLRLLQDRPADAEAIYEMLQQRLPLPRTAAPGEWANLLNNRAQVQVSLGQFAAAEETLKEAIHLASHGDIGAQGLAVRPRSQLAELYLRAGRLSEAEQEATGVLDWISEHLEADHPIAGSAILTLGRLREQFMDIEAAEGLYETACRQFQLLEGPQGPSVATCYALLGGLYHREARLESAENSWRDAIRVLESHPGKFELLTMRYRAELADVLFEIGQDDEAERLLTQAEQFLAAALEKENPILLDIKRNRAIRLLQQGNTTQAKEELLALTELERSTPDGVSKLTRLLQGQLAMRQGESKAAEALLGELSTADELDAEVLETVFGVENIARAGRLNDASLRADLLLQLGRPVDAVLAFEQGLSKGMRSEGDLQGSLSEEELQKIQTLRLMVWQAEDSLLKFGTESIDNDQVRAYRNRLQNKYAMCQRELAQFRQKLTARLRTSALSKAVPPADSHKQLAELQASLKPDAACVGWLITDRRLAFILRSSGQPQWLELGTTENPEAGHKESEPNRKLIFGRGAQLEDGGLPGFEQSVAALRRDFWEPVERALSSGNDSIPVKRLIVLPSFVLNEIPVECIIPDTRPVARIPSIEVLRKVAGRQHDKPDTRGQPKRYLGVGDPDFEERQPGVPFTHWARLPGSRIEIRAAADAAAKAGAQTQVLLGEDASIDRLSELARNQELSQMNFIHLATHGRSRPRRLFDSSLVFSAPRDPSAADPSQSGRTQFLTARDILTQWKLNADVVVLSACQSAVGVDGGLDGSIGLPQVCLLAGARNVLVTLWDVDDTAATLLIHRFFLNLTRADVSPEGALLPAESLLEARNWLRRSTTSELRDALAQTGGSSLPLPSVPMPGDAPFSHPRYWAAFVLVGTGD